MARSSFVEQVAVKKPSTRDATPFPRDATINYATTRPQSLVAPQAYPGAPRQVTRSREHVYNYYDDPFDIIHQPRSNFAPPRKNGIFQWVAVDRESHQPNEGKISRPMSSQTQAVQPDVVRKVKLDESSHGQKSDTTNSTIPIVPGSTVPAVPCAVSKHLDSLESIKSDRQQGGTQPSHPYYNPFTSIYSFVFAVMFAVMITIGSGNVRSVTNVINAFEDGTIGNTLAGAGRDKFIKQLFILYSIIKTILGKTQPCFLLAPNLTWQQLSGIHPGLPVCVTQYLPPNPIGIYPWVVTTAIQCLAALGATGRHKRLALALSIARSYNAHARHRMLRNPLVLALLQFCTLDSEPPGSSVPHRGGREPSPNQGFGDTNSRLEDRSDIWSGQGPGPELPTLPPDLHELWDSIFNGIPETLHQGADTSSLRALHDPATSPTPQQPDYAPPVPIPLDPWQLGYLAGFSAGVERASNELTNLVQILQNSIQYPRQAPSIQGTTISHNSAPPTAASISTTAPLVSLDGWTEAVMAVDYHEPLPNAKRQPTSLCPSDGLPQNLTTGVVFNTKQQTPILDAGSSSHPSDQLMVSHPEIRFLYSGYSQIPNHNSPANDSEIAHTPTPLTLAPQSGRKHATSASISGISPIHIGTKHPKHRCDSCNKSFRRPYLLEDHKRTHTNEGTNIYRCGFPGCIRVYASQTNMRRHFKTHFRVDSTQGSPPTSNEQMPEGISDEASVAGPSTHNMGSTRHPWVTRTTGPLGRAVFDPALMRHQIRSAVRLTSVECENSSPLGPID